MSKSKKTRKPPKRRTRRKLPSPSNSQLDAAGSQAAILSALQLQQAGDLKQAESIYRQVLQAEPENPDAWHLLGMTLFFDNRPDAAIECLKNASVLVPDHPDVLANLGVIYRSMHNLEQAQKVLEKSVQANPRSVQSQTNLGTVYLEQGNFDAAQTQFQNALSIDAEYDQAAMNLANLWQRQGKFQDAEAIYRSVLGRGESDPLLLNNLAETLRHQRQWEEAVNFSRQAVSLASDSVEFRITLGRCLSGCGDYQEAQSQFELLIEQHPNLAIPYHYLGKLQFDQRDMVSAEANLKRAVQLDPSDVYALSSLGFAYMELGQNAVAEACFRTVVSIDPSNSQAHGCLLFFMSGKAEVSQQSLFEEHKKWGEIHGAVESIVTDWQESTRDRSPDRRLRVGYISPDFCNHAVTKFFLPVLQSHRSEQVETFCYAEVAAPDETTEHLMRLANHWRFTQAHSDEQVAQQILADEIDILVDLAGHTGHNRLRVFAFRPAPIQVTWLGYPNTTGLTTIDYRLTCEIQNPPGEPTYHTEQLFRLPHGSFCFARPEQTPDVSELPAARKNHITFGALHRPSKISASARDLWAAVLKACPNSRLVVFNTRFTAESADELRQGLVARGIDSGRIDILNRLDGNTYLEIYHEVDIALDVTPWAGGTTTLEALWMGVPVIAFCGDRRSARSTAVIVHNVGHSELVANSVDQYVAIAVQLASNLEELSELRKRLRDQVEATIVDAARFTTDLEEAYREMWTQVGSSSGSDA